MRLFWRSERPAFSLSKALILAWKLPSRPPTVCDEKKVVRYVDMRHVAFAVASLLAPRSSLLAPPHLVELVEHLLEGTIVDFAHLLLEHALLCRGNPLGLLERKVPLVKLLAEITHASKNFLVFLLLAFLLPYLVVVAVLLLLDGLELVLSLLEVVVEAVSCLLKGLKAPEVYVNPVLEGSVLGLGLPNRVEGLGVAGGVENLIESLLKDGALLERPRGVFLVTEDDVLEDGLRRARRGLGRGA